MVSYTSERGPEFFNTTLRQPLTDVSLRFEAYCLSGVEGSSFVYISYVVFSVLTGVVNNYAQELLQLKAKTSTLILEKLRECFGSLRGHS